MDRAVGTPLFLQGTLSDDDRRIISGFLTGATDCVATIDSWIALVLRMEYCFLEADWDDLQQEIRIRVLQSFKAGHFQGASELRTYVHRIAKNACIDHWRRAVRSERQVGSERVLSRRVAGAQEEQRLVSQDLVTKLMAALPAEDRRLMEMVHAQHLSYSEIAHHLGVANGTIKARVFRCRERLLALRRRLGERTR